MKEIEGYQLLANAIIEQACKDYKKAKRVELHLLSLKDKYHGHRTKAQEEFLQMRIDAVKKELKKLQVFFSSPAFEMLTKADPTYILNKLNREIEEEIENSGRKKSKEKV